jgi:hypothetical protein
VKELEGSVILRAQHCPRPGCKRAKTRSCSGQNWQSFCSACARPYPGPSARRQDLPLYCWPPFSRVACRAAARLPSPSLSRLALGSHLNPKHETLNSRQTGRASMDASEEQAGLGESQNQDGAGTGKGGAMEEPTARRSYPTSRSIGYVGAAPSSLATLAKGKSYFVDPYTPFTPRPATLSTRDLMVLAAHAHARAKAHGQIAKAHWVREDSHMDAHRQPLWQPSGVTSF